ncbi:MAG TPA: ATP-dependent helicase [Candidatus Micrarchaeaceae archaeon]|nr:ATP-dependent helicase [Candidatus Micrarchaeaceae archaeon]
MAEEKRWDDKLTGAAHDVAAAEASPLKVVAGPGTGKTFALKRRVARRLQEGCQPKRILAVTFTRMAATDLKNELAGLGIEGCDEVDAVTLHSLCFRMLARTVVLESTGRHPRPLLAFEERFMVEDLNGDGLSGIRDRQRRLQAFNAAWARLQSEEPGWPAGAIDGVFHEALLAWLRFHRAILVGELVPVALRYLRNNPESTFLTAYDHVFTDEYQDLNKAEQVLVDLLAKNGTHTIVGDEDQSIYSFKHAHPQGIQEFVCEEEIGLDVCRRCPVQVIDMANSLIGHNPDRADRQLHPADGQPPGEVHIVQWPSLKEEAEGLAQFIKARIDAGKVEAGKVLVLCPVRLIGYLIRDALNTAGVRAHSFFQEEILEGNAAKLDECQAQQAYTLLNLLADKYDRVALRCWCGFGTGTRRSGPWSKLRAHCEKTGLQPWDAMERIDDGELAVLGTQNLLPPFREARRVVELFGDLAGDELVNSVFPEDEAWSFAIRSLIASFNKNWTGATQLRDQLRVVITQPELPTDVEYVRVMSLHKSKGLTAVLVVVADLIEGLIPRVDKDLPEADQDRQLREQRRLFYVAMTRTKQVLVLSSVARLRKEVAFKVGARPAAVGFYTVTTIASRFMDELGTTAPRARRGKELAG